MSSETGWTPCATLILYCVFCYNFFGCLTSPVFAFHILNVDSAWKAFPFGVLLHVLMGVLIYYLPSLLGPNSCKLVKFISAACQKYKSTTSFLFSCIYLFLSAHPILDNDNEFSLHAAALCAASCAAIKWIRLSGSSLKASLIFACWFVPASIVASNFLYHTQDPVIYWPTVVALLCPFVPVDYKALFKARLAFNKPPPPIHNGRRPYDVEMPLDREAKARCVKDDKKIKSKCLHGSVREDKKDDDKKIEPECPHGSEEKFVPVDYKELNRARLVFNKPPPSCNSGGRQYDIEMPLDRESKACRVKDDKKMESKCPAGSVTEGKKDDDETMEPEHPHGSEEVV